MNEKTLPPDTTSEEDRKTAGQRRINVIWEVTQATIAVMVSIGTLYVVGMLVLREGSGSASTALLLLSNAFFMIITSYFQRTNHTRTGGTGTTGNETR